MKKGLKKNIIGAVANGIIPENIINVEAYYELEKVLKHELLNDKRLYTTSDVNLIIDLAQLPHTVKKKISHLPLPEQSDILAYSTAVRSMFGKASALKQAAYGMSRGHYAEDTSFLNPRMIEILELFGNYHTTDEVHKIINQQWQLPVSKATVVNFKNKHEVKIKELQEKYKRDFSHVRLGYKKSRLDELTYLYQSRKDMREKSPTVDNDKMLLKFIEQIRKECEGDEIKVNFEGKLDVNATIDLHIQTDIMQKVSIKDIVLARLCAKYGVDPKLILHRLHRSIYAKFTGTKPADGDIMEDQIIYPSQHIYDFDKIKKLNDKIKFDEAQIVEETNKLEILPETKKQEISNLKSSLMEKLKQKQEEAIRIAGRTRKD